LSSDSAEMSMVKAVARQVQRGDGHAGAIERNAVPQAGVVKVAGRRLNSQALAMQ
jgi:hypothetical protein